MSRPQKRLNRPPARAPRRSYGLLGLILLGELSAELAAVTERYRV
jgi:hypothetical protein